jgi:L-asparaginase/Glu-tRNA(Gln) amidotransferase subunit D
VAIEAALQQLARPVTVLAAGGTIAMRGEQAVPALDAAALVASVPALASAPELTAETVFSVPGSYLSLDDALTLAHRAAATARSGRGVVITTGTDTLEEVAVLCALVYDGSAPIVLTGANRPNSVPGADGPANLVDAVAVAGAAGSAAGAEHRPAAALPPGGDHHLHARRRSHPARRGRRTGRRAGAGGVRRRTPVAGAAPRARGRRGPGC